jgi:hypothetical protein
MSAFLKKKNSCNININLRTEREKGFRKTSEQMAKSFVKEPKQVKIVISDVAETSYTFICL